MAKAVTLTFDADLRNFITQMIQVGQAAKNTEGGLKSVGAAAKEAAKNLDQNQQSGAGLHGVLGRVGQAITGVSAGFTTASAALAAFRLLVSQLDRDAESAAERLRGLVPSLRSVVDAARGSPERVGAIESEAERLQRGGLTAQASYGIAAKAYGAGFPEAITTLGQVEATTGGALQVAETVDRLSSAFHVAGRQAPSANELIQMIVGAQQRTGGTIAENAEALGKIGPQAIAAGASVEDAIAAVALAAQQTTPKAAQSSVAQVFDVLSKGVTVSQGGGVITDAMGRVTARIPTVSRRMDFAGMGPVEGLAKYEREAPDQFAAAMKDAEFALGVRSIRQSAATAAEIRADATAGVPVRLGVEAALASPNMRALTAEQAAVGLRDTGRESEARRELEYQRVRAQLQASSMLGGRAQDALLVQPLEFLLGRWASRPAAEFIAGEWGPRGGAAEDGIGLLRRIADAVERQPIVSGQGPLRAPGADNNEGKRFNPTISIDAGVPK